MSSALSEFERLCQLLIEGAISDTQLAQLREDLKKRPEWQAEYRAQMQLHALLTWQHGIDLQLPAASDVASNPTIAINSHRRSRFVAVALLATAASVIIGYSILQLANFTTSGASIEVLASDVKAFREGKYRQTSRLKYETGRLVFRLDSGAEVETWGPIDIELTDSMRMRINQGMVTVDAGETTKGFVIDTENTHVVDLGTRFGVMVEQSGATNVAVFDGKVDVYQPGRHDESGPLIATLNESEGLRYTMDHRSEPIRCVFIGPRGGEWMSPLEAQSRAVITDVRDNVTFSKSRRFYRVAVGGMDAGAEARHTRGRRWFPLENNLFPDWLAGADVVETFAEDVNRTDFEMILTLERPAEVFVIFDTKQSPPEWLAEAYVDTGARLRLDDRAASLSQVPEENVFAVWKSSRPGSGVVTLGSHRDIGQPKAGKMYGVAVKELP